MVKLRTLVDLNELSSWQHNSSVVKGLGVGYGFVLQASCGQLFVHFLLIGNCS